MIEKIIPLSTSSSKTTVIDANASASRNPGMNERIRKLRKLSVDAQPTLSIERALHETAFYKENFGKYPIPVLRALNFMDHCQKKALYIGEGELIVGERGPHPKCVPTFPELTCHSVEDFHVLNTRDMQRYTISQEDIDRYEKEVIPYWQGKTQRERIFGHVPLNGEQPMRPVCLPSSWSNVHRVTRPSTARSTAKECLILK